MYLKLSFENAFVLGSGTIDFQTGFTSITGKNGKGKSLITELCQYALWGSQALRGKSGDYKKLRVTLDFMVRDKTYRATRGGSQDALLEKHGEHWLPQASGATPVNARIRAIFGYDYEVFLMANAVKQGAIEQLSRMKPTERRAMVDKTIGLSALDALTTYVSAEATALNREVGAVQPLLVEPIKPEEVPGDLADLEAAEARLRQHWDEMTRLQAAAQTAPVQPTAPVHPGISTPLADLVAAQAQRQAVLSEYATLSRQVAGIADPTLTAEEIRSIEVQWDLYQESRKKRDLKGRLKQYVCPACDHHWHDEDPALTALKDIPDDVPAPEVSGQQLTAAREALVHAEMKTQLRARMAELNAQFDSLPDHKAAIDALTAWEKADGLFQAAKERYVSDQAKYEAACTALLDEKFIALAARLSLLRSAIIEKRAYLQALENYEIAHAKWETLSKEVEVKQARAKGFTRAKQAIVDLRASVKSYLVPSLNQVASHLIREMTDGELCSVVADEEFNLLCDGKPVEVLSGSGEAVANLSLRLALGTVLTNRVFSSVSLDEIDAACDSDRAAYIAKCVQGLSKTFSQVIQISHKGIVADHEIKLPLVKGT